MVDCYRDRFGERICRSSAWYSYGRWVLLGVIIFVVIAAYLIFACVSARRRYKSGSKPYAGTQWALSVAPPPYKANEYPPPDSPPPTSENPAPAAENNNNAKPREEV